MLQYIQEGRLKHFDGIFYVYDLGNPNSVLQLEQYYEEISKQQGNYISIVVGNKADQAVVFDSRLKEYKIADNN